MGKPGVENCRPVSRLHHALKRVSWQDWASISLVGIVLVLPLAGLWHYQGPPMEEGTNRSGP